MAVVEDFLGDCLSFSRAVVFFSMTQLTASYGGDSDKWHFIPLTAHRKTSLGREVTGRGTGGIWE